MDRIQNNNNQYQEHYFNQHLNQTSDTIQNFVNERYIEIIGILYEQINRSNNTNGQLEQRNKELEQRIKELKQRNKELEQRNKELQQRNKELERNEELEQTIKELKQRNKELVNKIGKLTSIIVSLQPIKQDTNKGAKILKRDDQYCELLLALTIIPNGYIVKKLLREIPDVEWLAGILYEEGKIVDRDLNKAIKYYEEAAKKKHPQAIYRLGLLNQANKYGKPNDYIKMWQEAGKMGHLASLTDLGFLYENGLQDLESSRIIICPNPEKALSYYTEAARQNYPRALNNLASFYYNDPTHKNNKKCIQYFERATQAEYVKSLHNLGLIYYEGELVPFNQNKSKSLIKRSAEKGDLQGKLAYVEMVLSQPQKHSSDDLAQINRYCREVIAEQQDNSEAYYFLGIMYEGGYGVVQQPKTALLYYTKSARLQNPNAYIKLGECYKTGFGVEQDLKEAIRNYEKVKQTNPQVYVYMGQIYQNGGPDFPHNHKIAFDYYYNSCNLNVAQGFQALGQMYKVGKHVKPNAQKAQQYFKKARELQKKPNKLNASSQLIQSSYFRSRK